MKAILGRRNPFTVEEPPYRLAVGCPESRKDHIAADLEHSCEKDVGSLRVTFCPLDVLVPLVSGFLVIIELLSSAVYSRYYWK